MARARLTDEERAERRKARNAHTFSDAAYAHYDPKKVGFGSMDEWVRAADELIGKMGITSSPRRARTTLHDEDLERMGLNELPSDVVALKRAFKNMLFVVHPDHGGTSEQTRDLLSAFERLSKLY